MPHWSADRWVQNEDGSYTRRTVQPVTSYEGMTKAALVEELEARGLPKTGNKAELVARLEDDDLA